MRTMKRQGGFSLIELAIVLVIIGILVAAMLPQLQAFLGGGKVDAAKTQLNALLGYAQSWAPPNGDMTGISMTALDSDGYLPDDWGTCTNCNPWAGAITVTVNSSDVTQIDLTVTGIDDDDAGNRLAREMSQQSSTVGTPSYSAGTLSMTMGST